MNRGYNQSWIWALAGGILAGITVYVVRRRGATDDPTRRARKTNFARDRSQVTTWTFDHQFRMLPAGMSLRIEVASPSIVHWTTNQWDKVHDTRTVEVDRGVHAVELPNGVLPLRTHVQFTFYWPGVNRWEGEDFEVLVEQATQRAVRTAAERAD
jgi:glucoamylase